MTKKAVRLSQFPQIYESNYTIKIRISQVYEVLFQEKLLLIVRMGTVNDDDFRLISTWTFIQNDKKWMLISRDSPHSDGVKSG